MILATDYSYNVKINFFFKRLNVKGKANILHIPDLN